ncbi:MAG: hypothetical protein ABIB04_01505 [Patescibacteria group bacterium]
MGKQYQNKATIFLSELQKDLKDGKINEQEFKFLLGLFLKHEMNSFINESINEMLPESSKDTNNMTLVSYKRNLKFTYAG